MWSRAIIVAISLILLDLLGRGSYVSKLFEWLTAPSASLMQEVAMQKDRAIRQIKFTRTGALSIIDLEREVGELSATVSRVEQLEEDNRKLREQLGILPSEFRYISGSVVVSSDEMLLLKADTEGVEEGSVVVWKDNVVGIIRSSGARNVLVERVRESEEAIDVRVISVSGVVVGEGRVVGDKTSGIVLSDVSRDGEISPGMIVVTKTSDKMKEGLVVGKIEKIISSDAQVYQEAIVKELFTPITGDILFIIDDGGV